MRVVVCEIMFLGIIWLFEKGKPRDKTKTAEANTSFG